MENNKIKEVNFENLFVALKKEINPEPKQNYKGYEWQFWGDDNLLPQYFIDLNLNSAVHSAILRTKTDMTIGDGIIADDSVISKLNSLDDISFKNSLYKIAYDYILFGCFALGIVWSKDGSEIASIYHVDVSTVRAEKKDVLTNKIKNYYLSPNWENYTLPENRPVKISAYSKTENKDKPQLYFFKKYTPGFFYYNLPDYAGASAIIQLDRKINNFHESNIKNNLFPGLLIHAFGNPEPEEKAALKNNIIKSFSDTENSGKFFLSFFTDQDKKLTVQPIEQNNNHEYFLQLEEKITQAIMSSHRLTSPVLAGLPGSGNLGGNANEITTASELFYNQVIKSYQNDIIEVFKNLLGVDFEISNSQPVKFIFSESIISQILTQDELRELVGYEPLKNNKVAIEEEQESNDSFNENNIK